MSSGAEVVGETENAVVAMRDSHRDTGRQPQRGGKLIARAEKLGEEIGSKARRVKRQLRHKAAEVTQSVAESVTEEAERLFTAKRDQALAKVPNIEKLLERVSHALRAVKLDGAAEMAHETTTRLHELASQLEKQDLADVLRDVQRFIRKNPGLVFGGMLLVGFAAARFLKASALRQQDEARHGSSRRNSNTSSNGRRPGRRRPA